MKNSRGILTPSTDESTNFTDSCGYTVKLTANGGGAALGTDEPKTVTRLKHVTISSTNWQLMTRTYPEFTKTQENTIHYCETGNVGFDMRVKAGHDEPYQGLQEEPDYHGVLGAKPVDGECANECSRHIEQAIGHMRQL